MNCNKIWGVVDAMFVKVYKILKETEAIFIVEGECGERVEVPKNSMSLYREKFYTDRKEAYNHMA